MHDFTLPTWDKPRKNDIIIRQSDVESFQLCPSRVGYRDEEGYDSSPSEPMAFGSLVHAMIDKHVQLRHDFMLAKLQNIEYVKTLFAEVLLKDGHHPLSFTNSLHIDRICREAMYAYMTWMQQWWLPIGSAKKIVSHEQTRIKPLGMINAKVAVWVQGTADLVHEFGLDDWKTAGRGWDKGKAGTRIQAPTYVWLESEVFEDRSFSSIPFTYVVYDRAKEVWSEQTVHITPETIDAAKLALMAWAEMKYKKVFPPTPSAATGRPGRGWWCSAKFCGAWNICEYKAMLPDGKDMTAVRSPKWAN